MPGNKPPRPTKQHVIAVLRRLGMDDRIPEAERELPEVIDLSRDGETLARLGLSMDAIVNSFGGGPW